MFEYITTYRFSIFYYLCLMIVLFFSFKLKGLKSTLLLALVPIIILIIIQWFVFYKTAFKPIPIQLLVLYNIFIYIGNIALMLALRLNKFYLLMWLSAGLLFYIEFINKFLVAVINLNPCVKLVANYHRAIFTIISSIIIYTFKHYKKIGR